MCGTYHTKQRTKQIKIAKDIHLFLFDAAAGPHDLSKIGSSTSPAGPALPPATTFEAGRPTIDKRGRRRLATEKHS